MQIINTTIGVVTLISHILLIIFVIGLAVEKRFRNHVYKYVHTHILSLLFVGAMAALLGSLAYSELVGFPPCELCWIQRIFIYPQAILAFVAIFVKKKDKAIIDYLLPLSVIGGLVALYQSFLQWGFNIGIADSGCLSIGGECSKIFVNAFGYITIPFMSFTIFIYSIGLMLIYYQARKIHG